MTTFVTSTKPFRLGPESASKIHYKPKCKYINTGKRLCIGIFTKTYLKRFEKDFDLLVDKACPNIVFFKFYLF